jgi:integrase-like protein
MPTANAHCERLIGSIRRECLDYLIPLNASHLRRTLREWAYHYNAGRPHRSLGPGVSDQFQQAPAVFKQAAQLSSTSRVIAKPILGGLHHEYGWAEAAELLDDIIAEDTRRAEGLACDTHIFSIPVASADHVIRIFQVLGRTDRPVWAILGNAQRQLWQIWQSR